MDELGKQKLHVEKKMQKNILRFLTVAAAGQGYILSGKDPDDVLISQEAIKLATHARTSEWDLSNVRFSRGL